MLFSTAILDSWGQWKEGPQLRDQPRKNHCQVYPPLLSSVLHCSDMLSAFCFWLCSSPILYSALICSVLLSSAPLCAVWVCSTLLCFALLYFYLLCTVLSCSALLFSAFHFINFHCCFLFCFSFLWSALLCSPLQLCSTIFCSVLLCTALFYWALRCSLQLFLGLKVSTRLGILVIGGFNYEAGTLASVDLLATEL